jgi:hypothetical protein
MSALHETTAGLATIVRDLERLALELRAPHMRRIPPTISAACDALTCAAALLRAQQEPRDGDATRTDLLRDAVAMARSTVETTKMACREHRGPGSEASATAE